MRKEIKIGDVSLITLSNNSLITLYEKGRWTS